MRARCGPLSICPARHDHPPTFGMNPQLVRTLHPLRLPSSVAQRSCSSTIRASRSAVVANPRSSARDESSRALRPLGAPSAAYCERVARGDSAQLSMASSDRAAPRGVVRDALAIGLTSGAYAVSFGALGVTTGLSVAQTCALSLLMFTGASQFALLGVLAGGGGAVSAAATAALVGSRNALYALRMAPLLRVRGARRLLAAQLVIDESTAMAVARPPGPLGRLAFYATGLSVLVWWNLGTLAGALGGRALGDPETYGLDVAASAAFVALIAPQARSREARLVALGAGGVALAAVPLLPAGVPVMVGALAAVISVATRTGARD